MKVGVFLPYESAPQRFAVLAEDAGFDSVAYGEHVLFRRPILNAFVALAAAAAVTTRIRVLSALTLLPLYPAALAAKLASSLDVVANGRFDFGVGVGGEVPEEFEACGVDRASRGQIADESLRAVRSMFAGEPMLLPKPVQRPGPPVWVGGRSDRAVERAAEFGDVWLPYLVTPEQVAAGAAKLEGSGVASAAVCFVGVGIPETEARRFVARLYDLDEERVSRYVIAGEPSAVVERLREFRDAGASSVVLNLCAEGAAADEMARLAGREVRPALAG